MKTLSFYITKLVALITLSACASLIELDKEKINHASMDLGAFQNKKTISPLTQLSGVESGGASAGCSVCAH